MTIDYFRFTAEAGHIYKLDMTSERRFLSQAVVFYPSSEIWTGEAWVAEFNSNESADYQDGPEYRNSWHAEEPRDYYIRVESQWSNPPASYTLTVIEVVDDHANAP